MTETKRRPPEPYEVLSSHLHFSEPPQIANRSDAIYLLDRMINAGSMEHHDLALEALKKALEQGII